VDPGVADGFCKWECLTLANNIFGVCEALQNRWLGALAPLFVCNLMQPPRESLAMMRSAAGHGSDDGILPALTSTELSTDGPWMLLSASPAAARRHAAHIDEGASRTE
jgi:hypothetical protein